MHRPTITLHVDTHGRAYLRYTIHSKWKYEKYVQMYRHKPRTDPQLHSIYRRTAVRIYGIQIIQNGNMKNTHRWTDTNHAQTHNYTPYTDGRPRVSTVYKSFKMEI